jgi:sarcosine oxidase, subunit beta
MPGPLSRHNGSVPVESAEVVVIGGGAMGASTVWHLAELGITDVVLLERDALGAGSTSKSAGGVRAQFADELNVRIALRSLDEFRNFEERVGVDIDFHQAGYLFLLDSEDDLKLFRWALGLQSELGVASREISLPEAAEIVPGLDPAGLLGATFCPTDGYVTPEAVVSGWAAAARDRGVRVRTGEEAIRIDVLGSRIRGVDTRRGRISTNTIVCAAGVWSREVAELAGIRLPVEGERRWMHYTPEAGGLPRPLPLTVDFGTGFYFHSEGEGLVFGGREPALEDIAEHAAKRLPVLTELPVRSSWWGYYEMSPDHNAIVGEVSDPGRFLYATGFSGHGFQQAPAVGEHLAELIAGFQPTLDLSAFSLDRFEQGTVREEHFVI